MSAVNVSVANAMADSGDARDGAREEAGHGRRERHRARDSTSAERLQRG